MVGEMCEIFQVAVHASIIKKKFLVSKTTEHWQNKHLQLSCFFLTFYLRYSRQNWAGQHKTKWKHGETPLITRNQTCKSYFGRLNFLLWW